MLKIYFSITQITQITQKKRLYGFLDIVETKYMKL
jgi:hypothetical protein